MSDPKQVADPTAGASPDEPGALPADPQAGGGENVDAEPDYKAMYLEEQERAETLAAENGRMATTLTERYQPPPVAAAPQPPPASGVPVSEFVHDEDLYSQWDSDYQVPPGYTKAIVDYTAERVGSQAAATATAQTRMAMALQEVSNRFFQQYPELSDHQAHVQLVTTEFVQNPAKMAGRTLLDVLPEIAAESARRAGVKLGGKAPTTTPTPATPTPPATPGPEVSLASGDSPESAHAAPGATPAGAAPAAASEPAPVDPNQEYLDSWGEKQRKAASPLAGVRTH